MNGVNKNQESENTSKVIGPMTEYDDDVEFQVYYFWLSNLNIYKSQNIDYCVTGHWRWHNVWN